MQRAKMWVVVAGAAAGLSGWSGLAVGQLTTLRFETSSDGGQTWGPEVIVSPGATVYVRLQAELSGATSTGLAGLTFQPRVHNWSPAVDQSLAFTFPGVDNAGVATSETAYDGRHVRSVPATNTGRIFPFGSAGQGASSPSGVPSAHLSGDHLWYAGVNATLPGAQPQFGVGITQFPSSITGTNYNASLDVEVFRFAVQVNAFQYSRHIDLANLSNDCVYWYRDADGVSPLVSRSVHVVPGLISMVPAPGAVGLLGIAGLVALRRRRN